MNKSILFSFLLTVLMAIPTKSARSTFTCYQTNQGSGAAVGNAANIATYASCTTACYRLSSALSMANINAIQNSAATSAVSSSFLSFISGDKGCLPTISSSTSAAQTTSTPLIINPVTVTSADVLTCTASAYGCGSGLGGGIAQISILTCANSAATVNSGNCATGGIASVSNIAAGSTGTTSSSATGSTVACPITATAGTTATGTVSLDMAAIVSLFCVSYGTCCVGTLCNNDSLGVTIKSNGNQTKLNMILMLLFLCINLF